MLYRKITMTWQCYCFLSYHLSTCGRGTYVEEVEGDVVQEVCMNLLDGVTYVFKNYLIKEPSCKLVNSHAIYNSLRLIFSTPTSKLIYTYLSVLQKPIFKQSQVLRVEIIAHLNFLVKSIQNFSLKKSAFSLFISLVVTKFH